MAYDLIGLKIETVTDIGILITIFIAVIYFLGRLNAEGSYRREDKPTSYLRGIFVLFYNFILPTYMIYLFFNGKLSEILSFKLVSILVIQSMLLFFLKIYYDIYSLKRHHTNPEKFIHNSLNTIKKVNENFYNKFLKFLIKTTEKTNKFSKNIFVQFLFNILPYVFLYINLIIMYYLLFINTILFFKLVSIGVLVKFYLLYNLYHSFKQNSIFPFVKIKIDNERNLLTGNLLQIKDNIVYVSDIANNKYYNINADKIIYMEFKKNA